MLLTAGGTPLHVNTLEDENYYVVEGTLSFRLGERTRDARRLRSHSQRRRKHPLDATTARRFGYWASLLLPFEHFFTDLPSSWPACPAAGHQPGGEVHQQMLCQMVAPQQLTVIQPLNGALPVDINLLLLCV